MFPDEILEEIYAKDEVKEISVISQTVMINAIGEILEKRGILNATVYQSELL